MTDKDSMKRNHTLILSGLRGTGSMMTDQGWVKNFIISLASDLSPFNINVMPAQDGYPSAGEFTVMAHLEDFKDSDIAKMVKTLNVKYTDLIYHICDGDDAKKRTICNCRRNWDRTKDHNDDKSGIKMVDGYVKGWTRPKPEFPEIKWVGNDRAEHSLQSSEPAAEEGGNTEASGTGAGGAEV